MARGKQLWRVQALWDQLKQQQGLAPSVTVFNALIEAYGLGKQLQMLTTVFEDMQVGSSGGPRLVAGMGARMVCNAVDYGCFRCFRGMDCWHPTPSSASSQPFLHPGCSLPFWLRGLGSGSLLVGPRVGTGPKLRLPAFTCVETQHSGHRLHVQHAAECVREGVHPIPL